MYNFKPLLSIFSNKREFTKDIKSLFISVVQLSCGGAKLYIYESMYTK